MRAPRSNPVEALVAIGRGMLVTLTHMLRRPSVTIEYPFEKREPFRRVHGRHMLNKFPDGMEKCIGCELCAGACPADAILVIGAENPPGNPVSPGERYGPVYQINMLRCIFCGLCVEACPTEAITMTTFFEMTGTSRESLIYSKSDLLRVPPDPERERLGFEGDPAMRALDDTEQPGTLAAEAHEEGAERASVPVVWLPESTWTSNWESKS